MSNEETREAGLGMEFFTRRMFYGLPRQVRAELTAAWEEHAPRNDSVAYADGSGSPAVDIFEQYVGAIEDVLWKAGKRKLVQEVLGAAAEARAERRKLVADLRGMAAPDVDGTEPSPSQKIADIHAVMKMRTDARSGIDGPNLASGWDDAEDGEA